MAIIIGETTDDELLREIEIDEEIYQIRGMQG